MLLSRHNTPECHIHQVRMHLRDGFGWLDISDPQHSQRLRQRRRRSASWRKTKYTENEFVHLSWSPRGLSGKPLIQALWRGQSQIKSSLEYLCQGALETCLPRLVLPNWMQRCIVTSRETFRTIYRRCFLETDNQVQKMPDESHLVAVCGTNEDCS